ncbi:MAG TPA: hypothetical protein VN924_25190 [Bryobacteraceae bacterium]|jgi:hypothetical protein|nr:hypothetical protein [Bryobacteraceae bacterium]
MAGYLDHYGVGEERREKRNKLLLALGACALVALFLWFFFFVWDKTEVLRAAPVARLAQILRNHRQESRVRNFFDLLQRRDYTAAYALWNCTDAHPCKDYPLTEFMKDWGPDSSHAAADYTIPKSRSCGSGVIVTVDSGHNQEDALWVQRSDLTIGFSPYPVCQAGA